MRSGVGGASAIRRDGKQCLPEEGLLFQLLALSRLGREHHNTPPPANSSDSFQASLSAAEPI